MQFKGWRQTTIQLRLISPTKRLWSRNVEGLNLEGVAPLPITFVTVFFAA